MVSRSTLIIAYHGTTFVVNLILKMLQKSPFVHRVIIIIIIIIKIMSTVGGCCGKPGVDTHSNNGLFLLLLELPCKNFKAK